MYSLGLGPESLLEGAIYPQCSFSVWGRTFSLQSGLGGKEKAKPACGGPGLTATLDLQHLALSVWVGPEQLTPHHPCSSSVTALPCLFSLLVERSFWRQSLTM